MKRIEIFDPAMCCSTGVCGPGVDPELLRVATVVNNLKGKGVDVVRYNLAQEPQRFAADETVRALLADEGNDVLPITLLDGIVVKKGAYPTDAELVTWLGFEGWSTSPKKPSSQQSSSGCCCSGSGCC